MKKPIFTSAFRLVSISRFAKLCVLSLGLGIMAGVWFSCKKEGSSTTGSLTLDEAKKLFEQTGIQGSSPRLRNGEEEAGPEGWNYAIHIDLDWGNAQAFAKQNYNVNVVEVPILHSNMTAVEIVDDNFPNNSSTNPEDFQKSSLLFVQDSNGVISIAVLKISGTPAYLANNDIHANSFQSLDQDFEGRAAYFDLQDTLLKPYIVKNQNIYDSVPSQDTVPLNGGAADRWGFCIDLSDCTRCTGPQGHTCGQFCPCPTPAYPDCRPPRYSTYIECYSFSFSFSIAFGLPAPPTITITGGGVGGSNITVNAPVGSYGWYVNQYKLTHNNENLMADAEKAAISWACYEDILENSATALTTAEFQAKFNTCVEEQKGCQCKPILVELKHIGTHDPYLLPLFNFKVYGVISEKNCKTGASAGSLELDAPVNLPFGSYPEIVQQSTQQWTVSTRISKCVWSVMYRNKLLVNYFELSVPVFGNPYETLDFTEFTID